MRLLPGRCGCELGCVCRVVRTIAAVGGGACVAPDYTPSRRRSMRERGETIVICPGTYNLTATVTCRWT